MEGSEQAASAALHCQGLGSDVRMNVLKVRVLKHWRKCDITSFFQRHVYPSWTGLDAGLWVTGPLQDLWA